MNRRSSHCFPFNAPSGAKLDAWIDFNGDGSWGGPFERIADRAVVVEGDNAIIFSVPPSAANRTAAARFRLSTDGGLAPTGLASDGEVEDHLISIIKSAGPGELLVDLDARDASAGTGIWTNRGTLGDFAERGDAPVTVFGPTAQPGVLFDGFDDWYEGPSSTMSLEGNSDRTIEVWVYKPGPAVPHETMVAWGHRGGPAGTDVAFAYGDHPDFGAVGHRDAADLGWEQTAGGHPPTDQWHHLVYTYNGNITKVYQDGFLKNAENSVWANAGRLNAHSAFPIQLAAQREADGAPSEFGALALGAVRIFDGLLSPQEIVDNFNANAARYGLIPIDTTTALLGLTHRYSFNDGTANDSINNAHGTLVNGATVVDGQVVLDNDGLTQTSNDSSGQYVDLPDGIISALGHQATFEVWTTWDDGGGFWQRLFDFGTSNGGEDTSPLAPDQHYLYVSPRGGGDALRTGLYKGITNGVQPVRDSMIEHAETLPAGAEHHIAVVVDATLGTTLMYLDGNLLGQQSVDISLGNLADVNNWLGRSQWNDPFYNGSINEFRIYGQSLTPEHIQNNTELGPDLVDFGDLPEPYHAKTMDDDRARHMLGHVHIYMGVHVDYEADGQKSLDAGHAGSDGDDGTGSDDEDGVNDPARDLSILEGSAPAT